MNDPLTVIEDKTEDYELQAQTFNGRSTPQFGESVSSNSLDNVTPPSHSPNLEEISQQNHVKNKSSINQQQSVKEMRHDYTQKIVSLKKKTPQSGMSPKQQKKNIQPKYFKGGNSVMEIQTELPTAMYRPSKNISTHLSPLSQHLPGIKALTPSIKMQEINDIQPSFGNQDQIFRKEKLNLFKEITSNYKVKPQVLSPKLIPNFSRLQYSPTEGNSNKYSLPKLHNTHQVNGLPSIYHSQAFAQSPVMRFAFKKESSKDRLNPSSMWANPTADHKGNIPNTQATKYLHPKLQQMSPKDLVVSPQSDRDAPMPTKNFNDYIKHQKISKSGPVKITLKQLVSNSQINPGNKVSTPTSQQGSKRRTPKAPSISRELPDVFRNPNTSTRTVKVNAKDGDLTISDSDRYKVDTSTPIIFNKHLSKVQQNTSQRNPQIKLQMKATKKVRAKKEIFNTE